MDLKDTGKHIAKLRKKLGLTQAGLAEQLNISDKAISKWERGLACPDVSLWRQLSILLDTDIEGLLYGNRNSETWMGILILDERVDSAQIIYDKPLLHYLLSQFFLVGIKHVIVVGECKKINIPGVTIEYAAFYEVNQRFISNVFIIWGNRFLYGPDLTRYFMRAMAASYEITIIAMCKVFGDLPLSIDKKRMGKLATETSRNQYYAEPFVFLTTPLSIGISVNFRDFIKDKSFNVETLGRGMLSFEVSSNEKAHNMATYVRTVQDLMGDRIGCIPEILIRRGLANYNDAMHHADAETQIYLEKSFGHLK